MIEVVARLLATISIDFPLREGLNKTSTEPFKIKYHFLNIERQFEREAITISLMRKYPVENTWCDGKSRKCVCLCAQASVCLMCK